MAPQIIVIEGDGLGREVIPAAVDVIRGLGLGLELSLPVPEPAGDP